MSLREQLQQVLGTAYTLERELAGGGMSRVFVAEDSTLGRNVVVKVLAPELAGGVNFERFKREISLAARLQHPHIVPLLMAGEVDGLPFFTMPFVEGESLRARLTHGELPVNDAVAIMRDVAKALEYAHSKGVVHRDVKPDNVLLTGGSAAVTDFGVAKAVAASTHAGATLTSVGVALGTPAYMAPEQGSGDPSTDHRADIYAFGAMAYEMLTGNAPFTARTAQQLLAAHATQTPVPVTTLRPPVPPWLATLVMRCLEKRPADRPQSARELLNALDAVSTPSQQDASSLSPSKRRGRWVALAALAIVATAGALALGANRVWGKPRLNPRRVMVAPFENLTNDTAFALVGRMASDFITDGVSRLDSVEVVLSSDMLALAENRPGSAPTNRQLAEQLHAGTLLTGGVYKQGDSLRFQVRQLDVAGGRVMQTMEVTGPASNPMVGIRLVRDRLMGAFAAADNGGVALSGAAAPAYEAYKEYLRGIERFEHVDYPGAIPFLTKAVALDSTFGIAFATLAAAYGNAHFVAKADSVAKIAMRYRDRFPESHRALFDYTVGSIAEENEAMFRFVQSQAARDSGLVWLLLTGHTGARTNHPNAAAKALRAIAEPAEGQVPYWTILATAYHQLGDFDRELQTAERANALYPTQMAVERLRARAGRGEPKPIRAIIDSIVRVSTDTTLTPANYMLTTAQELRVHGRERESAEMLKRARAWFAERPQQEFQARRSSRRTLADVLFAMGQFDSSQARYAELAATDTTDIAARARAGTSAALRGDTATARRIALELSRLVLPYWKGATLYWRAVLAASLGERESAARLLEQAATKGRGFGDLSAHRQEEFWPLRADPAFAAVMRPKG